MQTSDLMTKVTVNHQVWETLSEFWNHIILESFGFEGTSGDLLVQPPNQNRANLRVTVGFQHLSGFCYTDNVNSTLILK